VTPGLVDSHCHLEFDSFDEDREAMLARAAAAGIGAMVTICTRLSRFHEVVALTEGNPALYCSVGIHPHHVDEEGFTTPEALIEAAGGARVVGIGETGLDYHYDNSPREAQRESFHTHIRAARETGLPLIIHARSADQDMIDILRTEYAEGAFGAVMHCFSSGRALAEAAVALGFYISLSGIVTFPNAEDLREIVRDMPIERLLVETDSPYLAPVPERGKRNEPAFVVHTAARVAELRGLPVEEFARISTENFYRLFTKARNPVATSPPATSTATSTPASP
jgi:TatD DNase family protein